MLGVLTFTSGDHDVLCFDRRRQRRDIHSQWLAATSRVELAGIVLGFIFVWPLALAYLVWKLMGYPVPTEWKAAFERNFSSLASSVVGVRPGYTSTGNFAFDEHRRSKLERLEEERRRLDEEARAVW
jgi:hypothetical protein